MYYPLLCSVQRFLWICIPDHCNSCHGNMQADTVTYTTEVNKSNLVFAVKYSMHGYIHKVTYELQEI